MKNIIKPIVAITALTIGMSVVAEVRTKSATSSTDSHDPVMAMENGRYYVFCTGMGIDMLSSDDSMKTWRREVAPLNPTPQWVCEYVPAYKGHTWAPDIICHNGRWYLYYSCSTFGKNISAIGVATNSTLDPRSPDYRWEDMGLVIHSEPGRNNWNAIDPNVVIDEQGQHWLTFGSFWDGIQLVRLSDDMRTPIGEPVTIARRRGRDDKMLRDNAIEAPFLVYKDQWWYLFVSHDYCCRGLKSDYKTVVGRSRDIKGPYLDRDGKAMLESGGTLIAGPDDNFSGIGHCSVYRFGDRWVFAAHAYDRSQNGASKLYLRDIKWLDEWPELVDAVCVE